MPALTWSCTSISDHFSSRSASSSSPFLSNSDSCFADFQIRCKNCFAKSTRQSFCEMHNRQQFPWEEVCRVHAQRSRFCRVIQLSIGVNAHKEQKIGALWHLFDVADKHSPPSLEGPGGREIFWEVFMGRRADGRGREIREELLQIFWKNCTTAEVLENGWRVWIAGEFDQNSEGQFQEWARPKAG